MADAGWYVGAVVKANHLHQEFKVQATDGRSVKGRTSQNAFGASLEAGRQLQLGDGWFIEPQANMSVLHVGGDTYRASNGLHVSADAGNSLQLRAGSLLGRRLILNDRDYVQPYVKLAYAHEFDGKSTVRTNGIETRTDLSGGRLEIGVGVAASLAKRHKIYADYQYSRGSKLDIPAAISFGYRFIW